MVLRVPVAEQAGAVLLSIGLLAGCVDMRQDIAVTGDKSIALVVSEDVGWPGPPAPGRVRVLYEAKTEVGVGAGAGAVVGAGVGLLCGPLAPYCVPMAALQGANIGMLGGAAASLTSRLPDETIERLRNRVEQVLHSQDLRGRLETDVKEAAKSYWKLESDHAFATVEIRLQEFSLTYTKDQRTRCILKLNVTVREASVRQTLPSKPPRLFEYDCPYAETLAWLDEAQGLVEANLAAGSRHLAAEIVSALAAKR